MGDERKEGICAYAGRTSLMSVPNIVAMSIFYREQTTGPIFLMSSAVDFEEV